MRPRTTEYGEVSPELFESDEAKKYKTPYEK